MLTDLTTLSGLAALLSYLIGCATVFSHLFRHNSRTEHLGDQSLNRNASNGHLASSNNTLTRLLFNPKIKLLLPGGCAAILNLYYSTHNLILADGLNFSLFPVLTLGNTLMMVAIILVSLRRPFENITLIFYPLAAIFLALSLLIQGEINPQLNYSYAIKSHIVMSMLAYSTLGVAFAQALLILAQNYQLKHKHLAGIIRVLPPLLLMEKTLFGLLWGGVGLLTLSIISGLLFVDHFFAQQVAHKTFFTLLAWGIFSTLLIGRQRFGWRGLKAVHWSMGGFILLAIGFIGTKLVLEFIIAG